MRKALSLFALLFLACSAATAEVLFVADEFPAMQVVAKRLLAEEKKTSRAVGQDDLPATLAECEAVVVYIHRELRPAAERAFIDYAQSGGRLVLLHHSISSGKRQNRDWFRFLGVDLPQGNVDQGGYKWIEGVTVDWANLAVAHYVMTNQVTYPETIDFSSKANAPTRPLPSFPLHETEVYLNHVLDGSHHLLMGLKFRDATGKVWMQATAGWSRSVGRGQVVYFMPGHTSRDFENLAYGRIVLNAICAPAAALP